MELKEPRISDEEREGRGRGGERGRDAIATSLSLITSGDFKHHLLTQITSTLSHLCDSPPCLPWQPEYVIAIAIDGDYERERRIFYSHSNVSQNQKSSRCLVFKYS